MQMQTSSKTNRGWEEEKRENTAASAHLEVAQNEGRDKRGRKKRARPRPLYGPVALARLAQQLCHARVASVTGRGPRHAMPASLKHECHGGSACHMTRQRGTVVLGALA
jgi:hypothetical protein